MGATAICNTYHGNLKKIDLEAWFRGEGFTFVLRLRATSAPTPPLSPADVDLVHDQARPVRYRNSRIGPLWNVNTDGQCPRMPHLSTTHPPIQGLVVEIRIALYCSLVKDKSKGEGILLPQVSYRARRLR